MAAERNRHGTHGHALRLHLQRQLRGRRRGAGEQLRRFDARRLHDQRESAPTYNGGGLLNNNGTVTLDACTVTGNSTNLDGGGLSTTAASSTILTDTIVAGDLAGGFPSEINGDEVTGSYDLIGAGGSGGLGSSPSNHNQLGVTNPLLAPLGHYGGPIETMALITQPRHWRGHRHLRSYHRSARPDPQRRRLSVGAFQASLAVESTAATVDTDAATLSLPGAVTLANQYAGTEITFDPAVFAAPQTITLSTGELELSNTTAWTSISGPAAGLTISGGGVSRVFQINSGVTASLSGLSISGGSTSGNGGGLENNGNVSLANCTLSDNSATGSGGGFDNTGSATFKNCTLSGNSATTSGGGLDNGGSATLTGCTFNDNSASANGGALDNNGSATLTDCTFSGNSASAGSAIQQWHDHVDRLHPGR